MKYLMIVTLVFVMNFSALGSSLFVDGDLPVTQPVEITIDTSESCDAEEPNPSDESKHFIVKGGYTGDDQLSSFQRVSLHYSNQDNLTLNRPPQL